MKRILVGVGAVFGGLIVVFVIGGLLLPQSYQMERSIQVDAAPSFAFAQVNNVKAWEAWSPWVKMDPTIQTTYGDKVVGQGASYSWTGEATGQGTLTITQSVEDKHLETRVEFVGMGTSYGSWDFEPSGDGTKVTWGFSGTANGISGPWFNLMLDGMLGPQFEDGLSGIKELAETEAGKAAEQAKRLEAERQATDDDAAADGGEAEAQPPKDAGTSRKSKGG